MLRRYSKGIAIILLMTFGQELILPSAVWALTGGPSQPEVNSFEPVGTNQMVDLSTGDFNYNIPLMVVPGPNGGYPINLAYHAGIGMEQEASWVGLGWNINPGAITRNLRGVPDDFSGDEIVEKLNLKKDVTVGVNIRGDQYVGLDYYTEYFGTDSKAPNQPRQLSIYHNNYRGYGYSVSGVSVGVGLMKNHNILTKVGSKLSDKTNNYLNNILSFNYSSESGLGVDLNFSLGQRVKKNSNGYYNGYAVGVGVNSKQGLTNIRFSESSNIKERSKKHDHYDIESFSNSVGMSFASSSFIDKGGFSMNGYNGNYLLTVSKKQGFPHFNKKWMVNASIITNKIEENEISTKSYGTLYSQNGSEDSEAKLDFNVLNDIPISKRSVNMGVPIGTNDVYLISGQGIGGAFKVNRNDIGRFYSSQKKSNNVTNMAGLEVGFGTQPLLFETYYHGGFDALFTPGGHYSYSGKWTGDNSNINHMKFQSKTTNNPLYEPYYFKISGERSAKSLNEWERLNGENPVAFNLGLALQEDDGGPKPMIKKGIYENPSKSLVQRDETEQDRNKRVTNIGFRTKEEIVYQEIESSPKVGHIYLSGQTHGIHTPSPINYAGIDNRPNESDAYHHIHEYDILKPDGTTYIYGLPAYNHVMKENVFANAGSVADPYDDYDLVAYEPDDATIANEKGIDHYYSGTEIPSFVHSHLLTSIHSADYVDLTGDGATEDDFGFYAKFNYEEVSGYKWRDPFYGADYIKGFYSNELDDKSSYSYGEKNLYYVHSIETKTHVAVFELAERADGMGVNDEYQEAGVTLTGEKQRYLKSIKLYSKNDPAYIDNPLTAIPIQTVGFEYSYELCQGIFNNNNTISTFDHDNDPSTPQIANEGGKLTLKKVWISYNGNDKGRLSPYEFSYSDNPDYSRLNIDRWGNYQVPENPIDEPFENVVNPYTRQDAGYADREANAAAWCMDEIILPSGGAINIDYESDDYGYVQDMRAAQMVEVYGYSKDDILTAPSAIDDDRFKLKKKNIRLWFKAEKLDGVTDIDDRNAIIDDYLEGISEIYFKVFEKLKIPEDASDIERARDYVVGYAKINPASHGADSNTEKDFGYVDLILSDYKTAGLNAFKTHPFKKAGWQYLRYNRPDLFTTPADYESFADFTGTTIFSAAVMLLSQQVEMRADLLLGQYNKYNLLRYCNKMSDDKKSFIRLNSPDHNKFGGGHRVKSVQLSDNWIEGERTFGTNYEYKTEEGKTSGVADYEPIVGGEENALKKPIWYNGNDQLLNFQHQDVYLETPLMEDMYPSARVVYSRVVTKNISAEGTTDSQSGIMVNEYYTSKDFPIKEDYTPLQRKGYNIPIIIPMGGMISLNNNGFSQGYSITLNDMSGKPKATSSYPYRNGIVEGEPFSEMKFRYKTNVYGDLDNRVEVSDRHGNSYDAIIGVDQELSTFEEEHTSVTASVSIETNVDVQIWAPPPSLAPITTFMPRVYPNSINYSESMYRGISTCKVITKSGLMDEVEVFSDGSTVVTKNLLYDAETGDVLLTSVNNEWDKPVYNYSYPAHWNCENMGGAYKNYRAKLYFEGGGSTYTLYTESGGAPIPSTDVLAVGDEVTVNDAGTFRTYYVTSFTGDDFSLEAADGSVFGTTSGTIGVITRSGRRNLQAVKSGTVVSLNTNFLNPLSNTFEVWNTFVTAADPQEGEFSPEYINLNTNNVETYPWVSHQIFVPNEFDCSQGVYDNYTIETSESEFDADKIKLNKSQCYGILQFINGAGDDTPREKGYISEVDLGGGVLSYTEQLVDFKIVGEVRDDITGELEQVNFQHLPSGNLFTANWLAEDGGTNLCWNPCLNTTILHADATEYSDDWADGYPYSDVGNPLVDEALETEISLSTLNTYRYGKRGIWRARQTLVYQTGRQQRSDDGDYDKTHINVDGEYEPWEPYNWEVGHENPKWDWVSEITRYNPYGFPIEERSRLNHGTDHEDNLYSSQIYGYSNSVVTAASALASYFEIGFTGFEQNHESGEVNGTGHIDLTYSGAPYDVTEAQSHTGEKSLIVESGENVTFESVAFDPDVDALQGIAGKEYIVSLWVNVFNVGSSGKLEILTSTGSALLDEDGNSIVVETSDGGEIIDGWKKLEVKFKMPETGGVKAKYTSTGDTYIDDLRIGPYDGGMVTYVYELKNLWLVAELDGLNYATFYNYDSEGNLVQVKKETEKGIVTVQAGRSNTRQN